MKRMGRVLLALGVAMAAQAQIPDSLTALNDAFRQAYAGARRRVLAGDGPLLIVNGDTAALVRAGRRSDAAINVPKYHLVKTIAHIPLAIYVALTPATARSMPAASKLWKICGAWCLRRAPASIVWVFRPNSLRGRNGSYGSR